VAAGKCHSLTFKGRRCPGQGDWVLRSSDLSTDVHGWKNNMIRDLVLRLAMVACPLLIGVCPFSVIPVTG
jgi:hypothetical protein